ncbi:MAG: hypothetical protein DRI37_03820 [Chloroflexi bacterium]|nr:MAG: hypothetical protein DRI37_03820 [Chloroflexota bacterium]
MSQLLSQLIIVEMLLILWLLKLTMKRYLTMLHFDTSMLKLEIMLLKLLLLYRVQMLLERLFLCIDQQMIYIRLIYQKQREHI